MSGYYAILLMTILGVILAFMINLISNLVWEMLFKKPMNKINGLILIIITFVVVIFIVYTQYPITALPSGIDKETTNIKVSWNNKGVALYDQGNYADAIACYDRAIEIDPGYALAWSNKGNALKALRRNAEAEKAFANARGGI
jgi:tetratricopeptide (TPR) repeat protein